MPICNEAVLHATVGLSAFVRGPVGLMDKASAPGAGDSWFESWAGLSVDGLRPGVPFNKTLAALWLP